MTEFRNLELDDLETYRELLAQLTKFQALEYQPSFVKNPSLFIAARRFSVVAVSTNLEIREIRLP